MLYVNSIVAPFKVKTKSPWKIFIQTFSYLHDKEPL